LIQTVAGDLVRYAVEDIKSQIAAFTFLGQLLAVHSVPGGHCPEAEVHGPQGGHEEPVLVDSLGVKVDQSVQGGPTLLVDGVVLGINAMQQALKIKRGHNKGVLSEEWIQIEENLINARKKMEV